MSIDFEQLGTGWMLLFAFINAITVVGMSYAKKDNL